MDPRLIADFTVPGRPVPKARPRVSQDRRDRNRTHTDPRTIEHEALIARYFVEVTGDASSRRGDTGLTSSSSGSTPQSVWTATVKSILAESTRHYPAPTNRRTKTETHDSD